MTYNLQIGGWLFYSIFNIKIFTSLKAFVNGLLEFLNERNIVTIRLNQKTFHNVGMT